MLAKLNTLVFGLVHRFASLTYRRLGIDNYTWSVTFFTLAAMTSFYMGKVATELAITEERVEIAEMRRSSALIGVVFFVVMAGYVLYFRKAIRKYATRHYDMGNGLNPWISLLFWYCMVIYFGTLPFMRWPGVLDAFLVGIGLMFLFAEPPPMENRLDRALNKAFRR